MSVYIFLLITAFLFLLFNYSRSLLPAVRTGRQNRGWPEHFYIRRDMLLPAEAHYAVAAVAAFYCYFCAIDEFHYWCVFVPDPPFP